MEASDIRKLKEQCKVCSYAFGKLPKTQGVPAMTDDEVGASSQKKIVKGRIPLPLKSHFKEK